MAKNPYRPKDHIQAVKTARKFLVELKKLSQKAPRSGVQYTKVVPDKTKYSRKTKHKKSTLD